MKQQLVFVSKVLRLKEQLVLELENALQIQFGAKTNWHAFAHFKVNIWSIMNAKKLESIKNGTK